MATFTKTQNTGAAAPKEDKVPRVTYCRVVNSEKAPWLIANVGVIYEGDLFINGIKVLEGKEGDVYLSYPSYQKMKDGQPVKNEAGKTEWSRYVGPHGEATKEALENLVVAAVQATMDAGVAYNTRNTVETEEGTVDVYLRENGMVASVNVKMRGVWTISGLTVREKKDGDAYVKFPYRLADINGEKKEFAHCGPGSKQAKAELEELIFPEVEKKLG